jgi:hypothetical protein
VHPHLEARLSRGQENPGGYRLVVERDDHSGEVLDWLRAGLEERGAQGLIDALGHPDSALESDRIVGEGVVPWPG